MRHGRWKVLARLNGGEFPRTENLTPTRLAEAKAATLTNFEIYDISSDPGEIQNLTGRGISEETHLIDAIKAGYLDLVNDSPAWTPAN